MSAGLEGVRVGGVLGEVRRALAALRVAPGPLVVAVSGGPDSVALLRALAQLRSEHSLRPLVVAHLNHQLRGADSTADCDFVHDLYQALAAEDADGFRWHEHAEALPRAATARRGLESAARQVRYRWLAEVARQAGAGCVATGHTADDQAETVVHRLVRGTGLKGLAGMPPRRSLAAGVDVIRPLLGVRRHEVLEFLQGLGQSYCTDRTNADPRFTRNRIRQELLPLLERGYNPAVVGALCRLAEQARALQRDVAAEAKRHLEQAELPRAGDRLVFGIDRLGGLSRRQLAELFRLVWEREGWPQRAMGDREWRRLVGVAQGAASAADLPGRIRARRRGAVLQIGLIAERS